MIRPLCLLLFCAAFDVSLGAQAPVVLPPDTVDGSANPELIPDVVAYRLCFAAISGTSQNSKVALARIDAKVSAIRLINSDKAIFMKELGVFSGKLSNAVAATEANTSLDVIVQSSIDALKQKLTPEGLQHLDAYVHSQKKFMKRVPYPPMESYSH